MGKRVATILLAAAMLGATLTITAHPSSHRYIESPTPPPIGTMVTAHEEATSTIHDSTGKVLAVHHYSTPLVRQLAGHEIALSSYDNGCPGPIKCDLWFNIEFGVRSGNTLVSLTRTETWGNCFFFCFVYHAVGNVSFDWQSQYFGGTAFVHAMQLYGPSEPTDWSGTRLGAASYDGPGAEGSGDTHWVEYVGWGPYSADHVWMSMKVHDEIWPVGSCCNTTLHFDYQIFADGGWYSHSWDY